MWTSADEYLEKEKARKGEILNNLEKIYDENKDDYLVVNLIELLVEEQISNAIKTDNYNNLYNESHTLQCRTDNHKRYIESNKSLLGKLNK